MDLFNWIYKISISKQKRIIMKRVTGIGGIFFKTKDPPAMRVWYEKHLGIPNMSEHGAIFEWNHPGSDQPGHTVWSPFEPDSEYFNPSYSQFMINYRVENLESLLVTLKSEGVTIVGKMEVYDYGKFGWIMDPEGNKIELWEPVDDVFRKVNQLP